MENFVYNLTVEFIFVPSWCPNLKYYFCFIGGSSPTVQAAAFIFIKGSCRGYNMQNGETAWKST